MARPSPSRAGGRCSFQRSRRTESPPIGLFGPNSPLPGGTFTTNQARNRPVGGGIRRIPPLPVFPRTPKSSLSAPDGVGHRGARDAGKSSVLAARVPILACIKARQVLRMGRSRRQRGMARLNVHHRMDWSRGGANEVLPAVAERIKTTVALQEAIMPSRAHHIRARRLPARTCAYRGNLPIGGLSADVCEYSPILVGSAQESRRADES